MSFASLLQPHDATIPDFHPERPEGFRTPPIPHRAFIGLFKPNSMTFKISWGFFLQERFPGIGWPARNDFPKTLSAHLFDENHGYINFKTIAPLLVEPSPSCCRGYLKRWRSNGSARFP
jgi:hypothetical protein